MGQVVAFVRPQRPVVSLLQRLRHLTDEMGATAIAAREAEARIRAAKRANRLAWQTNDGDVASDWTNAVGWRLHQARLASFPTTMAALGVASRLAAARVALGAPLAGIGKAEAIRLYREVFPEQTRQRAEREVSALLSAHRMTLRREAGAA